MSSDRDVVAVYDWLCRIEEDLNELKDMIPEVYRADRNRLVGSIRCFRVGLELRVTHHGARRPGTPPTGTGPDRQGRALEGQDGGDADESGSAYPRRL